MTVKKDHFSWGKTNFQSVTANSDGTSGKKEIKVARPAICHETVSVAHPCSYCKV